MPQNLSELIQQRIVRLLADGNSQREVARMLEVFQRCMSKILLHNRETGWPHQWKRGGSKKIPMPGKTVNCSECSERTDFGLDVQPDVLGSLCSTGDAAVSGGHRVWNLSDNGETVSSVVSPGSPYTTVTVGSGCAVGKGRGWLMPASSLIMESWPVSHGMGCNPPWEEEVAGPGRWSHKQASVHPDTEESNVAMGDGGGLEVIFVYVQDNAPPHTACGMAAFLDQQDVEVMEWLDRSPDMKPVEHAWDQMSVWIRDMGDPASTVAELNNAARQLWAVARPGRVRTLVNSMPFHVRALLATGGGHTRY